MERSAAYRGVAHLLFDFFQDVEVLIAWPPALSMPSPLLHHFLFFSVVYLLFLCIVMIFFACDCTVAFEPKQTGGRSHANRHRGRRGRPRST